MRGAPNDLPLSRERRTPCYRTHPPRARHCAGLTVITYDILYGGHQIWGATANMLISLSKMLRESAA